jgi:hypothetical protein
MVHSLDIWKIEGNVNNFEHLKKLHHFCRED